MPCDGKNPNCDRRRDLLAQLKCLISSMDRRKPCEWDEPSRPPIVYCPKRLPLCTPPYCESIKSCKFFDFRASIMYRCECIKRNGLQDRCMMWNCMGRPECMTKLYPICESGYTALLKLTDLGNMDAALRKFYCTDQAREAALAAYCRLACDKQRVFCASEMSNTRSVSNVRNYSDSNDFASSYRFCIPSPYVVNSCDMCCTPCN
ncbi:PREDICTED: uncharacterized protein LOC108782793 [Cyphomyrmex costatus]|uniref:Uncharacterized protein n=1 Tax=Cyphomyrmex costatus TaxID=456900 RepID=A0A195D159_9HYME|nr:PREDICTED: uncharacterized protein LOC108782793 [Cyphomyrmex costatus]KYN06638.1 hypothetical protein ALC62_02295 [Cyphomyrmex costatus]